MAQRLFQIAFTVVVAFAAANASILEQIKDALKYVPKIEGRQFVASLGKRALGPKKIMAPQKIVTIVGLGYFEDWNTLVVPVWLADSEYTFSIQFISTYDDPSDPDVGRVQAKIVAGADVQILYKTYYDGVASDENKQEIKKNLFLKALELIKELAKIEGNPVPTIASLK